MPSAKSAGTAKDKDRRKSGPKPSLIVTLKISAEALCKIVGLPLPIKNESPTKDSTNTTLQAKGSVTASNGDVPSTSTPGTPAGATTLSPSSMAPATEGPKKKGVKRSAPGTNGNEPKAKGKPGPKKKPRLEDGSIDPSGRPAGGSYHKLGPKANQGAINAGLRALDRTGKPCRKWNRGGFRVKSFTGIMWEIPRWSAPPKPKPEVSTQDSTSSAVSSNKENKDDSQKVKSEKSASAAPEGTQQSIPPSVEPASSPVSASVPIAT